MQIGALDLKPHLRRSFYSFETSFSGFGSKLALELGPGRRGRRGLFAIRPENGIADPIIESARQVYDCDPCVFSGFDVKNESWNNRKDEQHYWSEDGRE